MEALQSLKVNLHSNLRQLTHKGNVDPKTEQAILDLFGTFIGNMEQLSLAEITKLTDRLQNTRDSRETYVRLFDQQRFKINRMQAHIKKMNIPVKIIE